jgi:orotate phosphoribosyltransferase
MILNTDSALKVAEFLLQIKAVKLQPNDPFTWASGMKSPIYCDNRKTLSYPAIRTYLRHAFVEAIEEKFGKPEIIAGVATGGIAHGALVAEAMGLPFVYVRSSAKAHGMTNLIEGELGENKKVIVIEDLISTGGSSLKAVKDLRNAGAQVIGLAAIFSYGFEKAISAFEKENCDFLTLSDYEHLIKQAVKDSYVQEEELVSLKNWHKNPAQWSETFLAKTV